MCRGHVGGGTGRHKRCSGVAEGVTEVRVEVRWHGRACLVAQIEADGRELGVGRRLQPSFFGGSATAIKLQADELGQEAFGLDLRELGFIVGGLLLEHELLLDEARHALEQCCRIGCQHWRDLVLC
eukprot:scaffold133363_cov26-Tisochrysis_lutea.AAC.4